MTPRKQSLASKLNGAAFEVYMPLSTEERKVYVTLQEELGKEFKKGTRNRETAIHQLATAAYSNGSIKTHAYDIMELVKLAYTTFDDANRQIIAKDYFLKSVHSDMQVLKAKYPKMEEVTLTDLANETSRLEIVGIKAKLGGNLSEVDAVELRVALLTLRWKGWLLGYPRY